MLYTTVVAHTLGCYLILNFDSGGAGSLQHLDCSSQVDSVTKTHATIHYHVQIAACTDMTHHIGQLIEAQQGLAHRMRIPQGATTDIAAVEAGPLRQPGGQRI